MAPKNEHAPESMWHLAAKAVLVAWARRLPNVNEAVAEWVTPDGSRRSDIQVELTDGSRVALEVQGSLLPDLQWKSRHDDYERLGIRDVWLWWPRLRHVPWIVVKHGQPLWKIDPDAGTMRLLVGKPHAKQHGWWRHDDQRLRVYGHHCPPCVRDALAPRDCSLVSLRLTPQGIVIPAEITRELNNDHAKQLSLATDDRAQNTTRIERAAVSRDRARRSDVKDAKRPSDTRSSSQYRVLDTGLRCNRCGGPLSDQLADLGHHVGDCLARD